MKTLAGPAFNKLWCKWKYILNDVSDSIIQKIYIIFVDDKDSIDIISMILIFAIYINTKIYNKRYRVKTNLKNRSNYM